MNFRNHFIIISSLILFFAQFVLVIPTSGQTLNGWKGIANKNNIIRIIHDDDNYFISTLASGITVINKSSGHQTNLNRSKENILDNSILDMVMYKDELYVTGKYYGVGKITEEGLFKFNNDSEGILNSQWMQGILVENENKFFVGGLNSLYLFENSRIEKHFKFNELSPMVMVTDIKKNKQGDVYVSLYDWLPNANSLYLYSKDNLIPIKNPCSRINRICVDTDIIWLASDGDGLVKYENGNFTQFTTSNSKIPDDVIKDICIDEAGGIWMAQNKCITSYYDDTFIAFEMPENWIHDSVSFTSIDVDGESILVGTNSKGLYNLSNGEFLEVKLEENPVFCNQTPTDYAASGYFDDTKNFIMASVEGLNIYNPFTEISKKIAFPDIKEACVSPCNNDIWIRKNNPDSCLVKESEEKLVFSHKTIPIPYNEVFNIMAFDNKGRLWVATQDGYGCYDNNKWIIYSEKEIGFKVSNIKCLKFDDNGSLWSGSFGHGLINFDGNSWSNYNTKNSPIPSDYVGCIGIDKNNGVWMNCRHPLYPEYDINGFGLTYFNGEDWHTYNVSNSEICSDNIYSIETDKNNRLWLAVTGDNGVMSFDGKEWKLYNTVNSGLAFNGVNNISIDDKNDLIYFTHILGNGVSYAKLNYELNNNDKIYDKSHKYIDQPLAIYDMWGREVFYSSKFKGIFPSLTKGFYIIHSYEGNKKIFIR